jgi:competence protein ComEC
MNLYRKSLFMWKNQKFNKAIRIFLAAILGIFFITFYTGCSFGTQQSANQDNVSLGDKLKIHFIDVGQADSILIQQGNNAMLIDAGNNEDSETVKNYIANQGIAKLDYVVGTHPHEDHIGGLDYVINNFQIGKIYMPKVTSNTKTFEDVVTAIKNKGMQVTAPVPGDSFKLGEADCKILAPNSASYEDVNNYSIVIKITYKNNSFMFSGDAETISETEMLKKGFDVKADVLKVGHHGSNSSTSDEFLKKVSPKYAVISVGKDNDYGHPHKETMKKLKDSGITVYRTDESGTIICTSDGNNISFNTKSCSYNSPSGTSNNNSSSSNSKQSTIESTKSSNSGNNQYLDSNGNGLIKGSQSKIYHVPGSKYYDSTKNVVEWFKTIEEAEAAGYRPPNN